MDTKENLTQEDILSLIDDLEKVSSKEESLTITSNGMDTIMLGDFYWDKLAIQPLTTSQLPIITTSGLNHGTSGRGKTISTSGAGYYFNEPSTLSPSLSVKGKAEFEDDITLKGKSLSKILDGIEQRLAILSVNKELESDWEELKELGDRYRELEAEIIAKQTMFNTLKD